MECFAFCTASSYRIKPFFERMRVRYKANLHRDVVHVEFPTGESIIDAFFFSYGATVLWGGSKEISQNLLDEIKGFEEQPRKELEVDEFSYTLNGAAKVHEDEITLPDEAALTKLAVSYAIAQSVKLGTFETSILKTFDNNKHLPEDLAANGKINLSRREIRRKMGKLFIERSSINLHLDVLVPPDFFWEYPELEPLYKMMSIYLDIDSRVDALNQRLDVLHELLEMLGNELNHQHSSQLEWTIILLIVIEVVLTIAKDLLKLI